MGERPGKIIPLIDESERLQALDEFKLLTEKQKAMVYTHVHQPALSKSEIAHQIGVGKSMVYSFFQSVTWEVINHEMMRQQLRECGQLAVKAIRDSLISGTAAVKLEAAIKVLTHEKIFAPAVKTLKQDNKTIVLWEGDRKPDTLEPSAADGEAKALSATNGDQDSVLAASQAAGDSRIPS